MYGELDDGLRTNHAMLSVCLVCEDTKAIHNYSFQVLHVASANAHRCAQLPKYD
jgi:hypothetical protein